MNKRYQVFVSSTFKDLGNERLEVIKALLELDCIPCGMEYFPAASEDAWTYISGLIDQSDYYVVIVAGKYGSQTETGISFTQREYEYAVERGVPTIAFIHASPGELPAKSVELDIGLREKLDQFIALLRENLCKEWHNQHELGAVVSRSLTQLIKHKPRTGWIPASEAANPSTADEVLLLTKKVRELEAKVREYEGDSPISGENLADGEDLYAAHATFLICYDEEVQGNRWPRRERRIRSRHTSNVNLSWNTIFRAIASKIAPTSSESGIRNALNALVAESLQVPEGLVKKGDLVSGITLCAESYDAIKVQLMALHLVTVSKERDEGRAHSVMLWRLTELGRRRLFESLAIRKER